MLLVGGTTTMVIGAITSAEVVKVAGFATGVVTLAGFDKYFKMKIIHGNDEYKTACEILRLFINIIGWTMLIGYTGREFISLLDYVITSFRLY